MKAANDNEDYEDIFAQIEAQQSKTKLLGSPEMIQLETNPGHFRNASEFRITSIRTQADLTTMPEGVQNAMTAFLNHRKYKTVMYILLELSPLFKGTLENEVYYAFLVDIFYSLPLYVGDHVKVFGRFRDGTLIIQRYQENGDNNYLLLDPSELITPSTLNSSSYCQRQTVLKTLFKPIDDGPQELKLDVSQPMLLGLVGHDIFEYYLRNDHALLRRDKAVFMDAGAQKYPVHVMEQLHRMYRKHFLNAYLLKMDYESFQDMALPIAVRCINWIIVHILEGNVIALPKLSKSTKVRGVRIMEVFEIEKYMESYEYGFCGIVDSLLLVDLLEDGKTVQKQLIPLELKTGVMKTQQYRMQSMIYSMLVQQTYPRYRSDFSLLLYIADGDCQIVETSMCEWFSIVFQRNFIAQALKQTRKDPYLSQLPEMLQNPRSCVSCAMNDICSSLQVMNDVQHPLEVKPEIETVSQEFKVYFEIKSRLRQESLQYLRHQLHILYEEENVQILKMNKEHLLYRSDNAKELLKWYEDKRFDMKQDMLGFKVASVDENYNAVTRMKNTFSEGDKLTLISDELRMSLDCTVIEVQIKERGNAPIVLDESSNTQLDLPDKAFYYLELQLSVLSKKSDESLTYDALKSKKQSFAPIEWIVRKRDYNPFLQYRSAIMELLTSDAHSRLRDILVGGVSPKFDSTYSQQALMAINMLALVKDRLNADQIQSIHKCIEAQDFAIIQGFPGTGKTFLVAHLLHILASCHYRVLVVTYTHSALDGLIDVYNGLFESSFCLRICGDRTKVSTGAQPFLFDVKAFSDHREIDDFLASKRLFFVTCLSSHDRILRTLDFDYCIVDEASQIIEPLCLSNVLLAKRFVLIGDHYQLSPLVKSNRVRDQLSKSMLQRLSEQNPQSVAKLTLQYRMNEEIMQLSNILVYEGQLRLGDPAMRQRGLVLLHPNTHGNPLLKRVYDPKVGVVFLNYSMPVTKTKHPQEVMSLEADVVYGVLKPMLDASLTPSQLGIITTYNKSARAIQERCKSLNVFRQVLTIDRSQGIDRECVMVVCSSMIQGSQLMNELRRINVALTRAKSKLIVIGSLDYLSTLPNFKGVCALLSGFRLDVDANFLELCRRV